MADDVESEGVTDSPKKGLLYKNHNLKTSTITTKFTNFRTNFVNFHIEFWGSGPPRSEFEPSGYLDVQQNGGLFIRWANRNSGRLQIAGEHEQSQRFKVLGYETGGGEYFEKYGAIKRTM